MFTGIVETTGRIKDIDANGSNMSFWIESDISNQLKPDQSVSHNGVCLTVEEVSENQHKVTAIQETLDKTNFSHLEKGALINLERCLLPTSRLDGHIVQGHVDTTGVCKNIKEKDGSREIELTFPKMFASLIIEKGSISVNGISLTAFNVKKKRFSVAIIPYTFEHTNIKELKPGDKVNLEFDILGKYILRKLSLGKNS
ncbi:MAG: riboflavin synthase [Chitinophagales bacterium]|nr:riboflavin synthase [Chitinophagales bacterium]